ncbi:pyridoxamine 5'-phosphate oxidase [Polymorphobacter arshaanensis]|uniref:Pyridoxamine 5'-phosphate oxidase n=1 Tax=Glacieibacterium arshaanense TaxID=2511025 RepID=A0A4Y9EQF1_9SPHN|nr:pyridoxamine 5'-phosphate oxidase family protein [Polymorphobacter arshaanensis]TFU05682.1 pyridoxamine 5'-phosphate oxidase [Polymorphobacter arshaanensis]
MTTPATAQRAIDIAFTPAIKAVQIRKGSRAAYERMEMGDRVDERLAAFIAERDSFYLGSASADGQPYIQHRGGPRGFLKIIDEHTLGFTDLRGNRQYVSTGNFSENPKAYIFLMDYAHRRRIKIWGRIRVVEDDPALIARLLPEGSTARTEAAMLFEITAWDANCPQHIPQLLPAADVAAALAERDARIAVLESELRDLKRPH